MTFAAATFATSDSDVEYFKGTVRLRRQKSSPIDLQCLRRTRTAVCKPNASSSRTAIIWAACHQGEIDERRRLASIEQRIGRRGFSSLPTERSDPFH